MENFNPDRVYDHVVLQVGRYNRHQSAFSSSRAWVYSSFALALITSIIGLINQSWVALFLLPIAFSFQILLTYYVSKEDTAMVILDDPFRALLYSFFYGSSPISLRPIQSAESSCWKDLRVKYLGLNKKATAEELPNPDIERMMSIELINLLRQGSYLTEYSQ